MLVQGIKSRPYYPGLKPDYHASNHIVIADGEGALAVVDMFAEAEEGLKGTVAIVFAESGATGGDYKAALERLPVDRIHVCPSILTAMTKLSALLSGAKMGTRVYATGTETLIGLAVQMAQNYGLDPRAVKTEHRGSLARRVQCVHCKGFTEGVTTNIVTCSHCGESLLVRDHYSRRIGAFMGVSANAEDRSELPESEEVFK